MVEAVRLADSEGVDGLSMRRLANALGAGAMSLYHYVASKDELLDAMVDVVFEQEVPRAGIVGFGRDEPARPALRVRLAPRRANAVSAPAPPHTAAVIAAVRPRRSLASMSAPFRTSASTTSNRSIFAAT